MAYQDAKPKSGMEGRSSRTERWAKREEVKKAAKKSRRKELLDELARESQEMGLYERREAGFAPSRRPGATAPPYRNAAKCEVYTTLELKLRDGGEQTRRQP